MPIWLNRALSCSSRDTTTQDSDVQVTLTQDELRLLIEGLYSYSDSWESSMFSFDDVENVNLRNLENRLKKLKND